MKRFDKLIYGLILGALLPVLGFYLGYLIKYSGSVKGYWLLLSQPTASQNEVFTFCMLPSLLFFYLVFFRWKLDQASKGLVAASLVYVAAYMIIKFL